MLVSVAFLFVRANLFAQNFEMNKECVQAYQELVSLQLASGKTHIEKLKQQQPNNLIPIFLENYHAFLLVFTEDNYQSYRAQIVTFNERINELKKGDKQSPYYLYSQAEILLQSGVLKLRNEDYISAAMDIRKAYKTFEENDALFPDFKANKKSLAMLQCVFGSIPENYKWGVKLLGLNGDINKGLKEMKEIIDQTTNDNFIFRTETIIEYAFLQFHLGEKPENAWLLLQKEHFPIDGNLMTFYTVGHIGTYGHHLDAALTQLKAAPKGENYTHFAMLDYLKGLGSLYQLQKDAVTYFEDFEAKSMSKNMLKSTYQKLAWCSLIFSNDKSAYKNYMQLALSKGNAISDADKQALHEAESGSIPNVSLLKARLLFDGGYYQRALNLLQNIDELNLKSDNEYLEYYYRLGRIYHESGNTQSAVVYYTKTIELGYKTNYMFAPNSALQLGLIYEKQGNQEKARYFYQKCLDANNYEYENSIKQKAKAGLNRLK